MAPTIPKTQKAGQWDPVRTPSIKVLEKSARPK